MHSSYILIILSAFFDVLSLIVRVFWPFFGNILVKVCAHRHSFFNCCIDTVISKMELTPRNKCCVPGCTNRDSKRHRFPNHKEPELFKKWLENVNNPKLKNLLPEEVYRSYYVCNIHFAAEYLVARTKRGLRRDAIPTLVLSGKKNSEIQKFWLLLIELL